jgi:hypothetical protein
VVEFVLDHTSDVARELFVVPLAILVKPSPEALLLKKAVTSGGAR